MTDMEISVEVQAELSADKGKGIARLDTSSMKHLGLISGDIIEIQGLRRTYAKCVARAEKECVQGILNIDGLIRNNARTNIGSRIYIKKKFATVAKKIKIAPLEIMPFVEESHILEALTWFPIIQGDNVIFENSDGYEFFRIIETIPQNSAVIATSKTELEIIDYLFLNDNKESDGYAESIEESYYDDDEFTENRFLQMKADFEK